MGASLRWFQLALTPLVTVVGIGLFRPVPAADDKPRPEAKVDEKAKADGRAPAAGGAAKPADWQTELNTFFSQAGDDPPRLSVPLRPATVDDRRRLEAVRLYTAARALEDRGLWNDAAAQLQEAAKLDPDSVAIARRLAKIYIGALGRPDLAIQFSRRVLAIEPGDTKTFSKLVDFYSKRGEPENAESLLNEILANPKLPAHAPGRVVAEYELGRLYYTRLKNLEKAANAFAKVMEDLDDKSANRLSPDEQSRIWGNDPASAYLNFGMVFLAAKRDDLVVKALERALVYDEDNPQVALMLAEALLRLHKPDRALEFVDRIIRRQPQGVEAYDLLAKVLKAMGREREITPRLEEAAQRDSKNVPLQYVLADRYRETGQVEKAEELYRSLLNSQPTPQTYAALATSLLKRKKTGDLLKVFCDAWSRPLPRQAILPIARTVAEDDALTEAILDTGTQQLSANPPALPPIAFRVLAEIASVDRAAASQPKRLERLLKLRRLELAQSPSPLLYREIAATQRQLNRYLEAAATFQELFNKFPGEKSVAAMTFVADCQRRAGQNDAARTTLAEAQKLNGNDFEAARLLASRLADVGQIEDALRILRDSAKREPNNHLNDVIRAEILSRFGRNEEAIKVYEDILKRFSDNDEAVKFARAGLSGVYVNMGNYPKGEAELEMLLQRNPEEAGPNNDLGYLYAEQGKNLEKAETMIQKALQEEPENFSYLDSLGWVLFKRGKLKEALDIMKKAADRMKLERLDPDATILDHLGDVYFKLQDVANAKDSWREALKAAEGTIPPDKRVGEIRKKLDALRTLDTKPKPASSPSP
jgi:tetratricopeptide (TPR) repeat protein